MRTLKDFGDRLEYLIVDVLRVSKNEFCTRVGISAGNLTRMINADEEGKKVKPGAEKLEAILISYPKVNMDWLIAGKGTPLKESLIKEATLPIQFDAKSKEMERELELTKSRCNHLENELKSKEDVIAEKERTISVLHMLMKNMGFKEMDLKLGKLYDKFLVTGKGISPFPNLSY